jgi:hypothetical protein
MYLHLTRLSKDDRSAEEEKGIQRYFTKVLYKYNFTKVLSRLIATFSIFFITLSLKLPENFNNVAIILDW